METVRPEVTAVNRVNPLVREESVPQAAMIVTWREGRRFKPCVRLLRRKEKAAPRRPGGGPGVVLGLDDLIANGVAHQFAYGMNLELVHQVGAMRVHGLEGNIKRFGNFLGALGLRD